MCVSGGGYYVLRKSDGTFENVLINETDKVYYHTYESLKDY